MALLNVFEEQSCVAGWLAAVRYLSGTKTALNLIVGVAEPITMSPQDFAVVQRLDDFLVAHDLEPINTTASTIFPAGLYLSRGAEGVFRDFVEYQPKIRGRWDGYAARMLHRSLTVDGEQISPLEHLIRKMRRNIEGGRQRAIYELGIEDPADPLAELSIYRAEPDARQLHPPCLMHVSLKMAEGRVHLTALYRSHYYIQKALGNLIGLAQLQSFVASETGLETGALICHSTYGTFDTGDGRWSLREARNLVAELTDIHDSSRAKARAKPARQ